MSKRKKYLRVLEKVARQELITTDEVFILAEYAALSPKHREVVDKLSNPEWMAAQTEFRKKPIPKDLIRARVAKSITFVQEKS